MLAALLGWLFIIMGIIFMLRPQILRDKLCKKSYKIMRKYLLGLSVFLGILMIGAAWRYEGILPKIIMVVGIIAILKGFLLLKSKLADKMVEWLAKQPLIIFRIGASMHIAIGIVLLNLR